MEGLIILFLLFGGWRLVIWLLQVGGGAASDVARGRASFKDSVTVRAKGMSKLEVQVADSTAGDDQVPLWRVKIRGLFPITQATDLTVIISVLDVTDQGKSHPVLSALDDFQESDTRAFQFVRQLARAEPGQGFLHWVDVGVIPKDLLMYPFGGSRKIAIVVRLVNNNQMPRVRLGLADASQSGIVQLLMHTETVQVERGYLERSDEELGIAAASVRLGIALAYADGNFDPVEGKLIKEWAVRFVNQVPEGRGRDDARSYINDAIRFGNDDARTQNLSMSAQVDVLNKLGDKPEKYAAIELCLDVMAADGEADPQELRVLTNLCESLGLDKSRFDELRDHRMINVDSAHVDGLNIWDSLGIASGATDEEKKAELKKLYRRWNARAESLEDDSEREKAHQKLERIAEARRLLNA